MNKFIGKVINNKYRLNKIIFEDSDLKIIEATKLEDESIFIVTVATIPQDFKKEAYLELVKIKNDNILPVSDILMDSNYIYEFRINTLEHNLNKYIPINSEPLLRKVIPEIKKITSFLFDFLGFCPNFNASDFTINNKTLMFSELGISIYCREIINTKIQLNNHIGSLFYYLATKQELKDIKQIHNLQNIELKETLLELITEKKDLQIDDILSIDEVFDIEKDLSMDESNELDALINLTISNNDIENENIVSNNIVTKPNEETESVNIVSNNIETKTNEELESDNIVTDKPYYFNDQKIYNSYHLAEVFISDWDEALKHVRMGFLIDLYGKYSDKLEIQLTRARDCENLEESLVMTIFALKPDLEYIIRGDNYSSINEIIKKTYYSFPEYNDNIAIFLKNKLISKLMVITKDNLAFAGLYDKIIEIEEKASKDFKQAYTHFAHLLDFSDVFTYDNKEFKTIEQLVEFIASNFKKEKKFTRIANDLINDENFFLWLIIKGYGDQVEDWKQYLVSLNTVPEIELSTKDKLKLFKRKSNV